MKRIIVLVLLSLSLGRLDAQVIDLSVPASETGQESDLSTGTILINIAVGSQDVPITYITLDKFKMGSALVATVAARIYSASLSSSPSPSLLAANAITVASGSPSKILVPLNFTLKKGKEYFVGFFLQTPNSTHSLTVKQYFGAHFGPPEIKVNSFSSFYAQPDAFTTSGSGDYPYIRLGLDPVGFRESFLETNFLQPFPNPAADYVAFDLQHSGAVSVEIWNGFGQCVVKQAFGEKQSCVITISSLPKGVYSVRFFSELVMKTARFVKE